MEMDVIVEVISKWVSLTMKTISIFSRFYITQDKKLKVKY
jgi:hypothetical protein